VVHLDCLSRRDSAATPPRRLQELLCASEVSVDYIHGLCAALCASVCKSCTWKCMSSITCAALVRVCLPELCAARPAPKLVCLQEFCAAPRRVYLQESSVCYTLRSIVYNFFVCFGFFQNKFVCFGCSDTCSKHRNKPKKKIFGFTKQTEKQPKQIVFRFFSVQTKNIFCLFRGHPIHNAFFTS
jgi:hypothetical protein